MRTTLTLWSAATFAVLWVGFSIVVVDDGREFESINRWFDSHSLPVRAGLWVLFLPIVIGVKTWTSSSTTLRAVGATALLIWTVAAAASLIRIVAD